MTSAGNLKPVKADCDGSDDREREAIFTGQSCPKSPIGQRNSPSGRRASRATPRRPNPRRIRCCGHSCDNLKPGGARLRRHIGSSTTGGSPCRAAGSTLSMGARRGECARGSARLGGRPRRTVSPRWHPLRGRPYSDPQTTAGPARTPPRRSATRTLSRMHRRLGLAGPYPAQCCRAS
jgi:hypothetical protein